MDTDAHPLDPGARMRGESVQGKPVQIDDDVFIGTRAIILKGVHIHQGAVIGAGAVVARDVPPFAVVAGNPAKVVGDSCAKKLPKIPCPAENYSKCGCWARHVI